MNTMPRPILTKIDGLEHFKQLLDENPGLLIIKFGAEWCQPCREIKNYIHSIFSRMPPTIQPVIVDVDESIEIYSFLKSKRMIPGVPAILCYYKGNRNYVPDDSVIGASSQHLNLFFERCSKRIS